MLKSDEKVLVSKELVQQFKEINTALEKCCDLALQQPIPNKQIALMTDASFCAAGYAVLMEDDPSQKLTSLKKSFAPVAYGSKTFTPAQIKMPIYAKEFLTFLHSKNLGISSGVHRNRLLYLQTTKLSRDFFKRKLYPKPCGMRVIM